jgi:hypothetical protein
MRTATALLLALLLPLAVAAQPSTGNPVVYRSGDVYGLDPVTTIQAANDQQLFLYLDYANDPDGGPSSAGATMCVDADGDETCAFDVWIEMATDTATFDSFTPADPAKFVSRLDPTSLRVNGIEVAGMAIPAPIGTLVVDALGASQIQISVLGVHRVGAAGQLDAIQPTVILVPEPGRAVLLGSGIAGLAALQRLRRRPRRSGA